ncbi:hypothetical protein Tco_1432349, partial [Tanacetum coccineum]
MSYNGLSFYLCGDPLDGILCRRCSCGWCGNKLDDGFCSYCASQAENSFAYDPNPNSFDNSQYFSDYPPQPQFETYSCEIYGNDSHYGYDCPSRVSLVYEPEPCYNQNFSDNFYPQNSLSFSQQYLCCANCGGPHYNYQCQPISETYYEPNPSYDSSCFDQPQPSQDSVDRQRILHKMQEELEEIKRDWRKLMEIKKQIAEEQAAKDRYKKIPIYYDDDDGEYCIQTQEYLKEFSSTNTPDLPIKEPDNSLIMGDEHLSTIPETKSDEVIKSSVENLVPIPSELEGIPDKLCDVPTCDNDRINVESNLIESLINRDTSIDYSSKIDPLLEEFASELAHIAPIPPGIVEADFDPNDDTSSDDDDFEDIEYVSLEEVNDVDQEEKEFNLEDILQIQDVILREKLLNVYRLIANIESLNDHPTPDHVLKSPSSFPIPVAD